jgi:outer membrane receptor protein involved in Fe transport
MLDNLVITKTSSPDLPGEFVGGVVQINTKSVPDKNFQSITIGSGYNTITTFKEQKTYKGSGTDWIGFDNGARDLPSNFPSTTAFNALTYQEKAALAKTFEYDWKINSRNFKPNTSIQYSIGRNIDFNDKNLGVLFSVSHSITNSFNEITRSDYDNADQTLPSVLLSRFKDDNYSEQVLTAAIANFSFKMNENHSINFKNILSINSNDLVVEREGKTQVEEPGVLNSNVRWFTSNKIYSGQFNGEHYFPVPKIKINWTSFLSDIERLIPNLRRNIYFTADPESNDPAQTISYAQVANNNGGPDYGGGMFFSENKEKIYGGKLDVSKKINFGENWINELKMGGLIQNRKRDFFARQLQYNILTSGGGFDYDLLTQSDATIFSVENMGVISPGVNGFTLFDLTKFNDSYTAGSELHAAYGMLDNRFKQYRLVWGIRVEDYTQTLQTRLTETEYLNINEKKMDILPSANLIIAISKKANLRLSYSKTLNRPEFRELAPFGFYDFTTQFFTQGNANLKRATVQNYDFRYEIYPGKGQLFSVSYFIKKFKDPIEVIQQVNNRTIGYENAKSAKNNGLEIEFRTLLSSLFKSGRGTFLDDLTLFSNAAFINSKVDVSNVNNANRETNRPMQGQSPYVLNAGLQYANKENGWVFSTNINRVGNRIAFASSEIKPAIWEKARTFLDLQIAKIFYQNKMELKLNVQNILAQDLIFYQNNYRGRAYDLSPFQGLVNDIFTGDLNNEDGYDSRDDDAIWITKFGRTFSLSFTYNF